MAYNTGKNRASFGLKPGLRPILAALLFLALAAGAPAQEKAKKPAIGKAAVGSKAAIGIGPEWNMNSRENFAGGAALAFDYTLPHSLALGLTFTASTSFSGFGVLEPAALFRWYFLGRGQSGFFAQADLGCYVFFEDGETAPLFDGGLRGGFRLPLGASFYVEPYARVGYPFVFGIGAMAGMRF